MIKIYSIHIIQMYMYMRIPLSPLGNPLDEHVGTLYTQHKRHMRKHTASAARAPTMSIHACNRHRERDYGTDSGAHWHTAQLGKRDRGGSNLGTCLWGPRHRSLRGKERGGARRRRLQRWPAQQRSPSIRNPRRGPEMIWWALIEDKTWSNHNNTSCKTRWEAYLRTRV